MSIGTGFGKDPHLMDNHITFEDIVQAVSNGILVTDARGSSFT